MTCWCCKAELLAYQSLWGGKPDKVGCPNDCIIERAPNAFGAVEPFSLATLHCTTHDEWSEEEP